MSQHFHSLRLKEKIQETEDSCSFIFEVPTELKEAFSYTAGQYLTIKVEAKGQEHRRAYSIFTAPADNRLGVTIKRVKGGTVSNHLIDKVQEGSALDVMLPEGRFIAKAEAGQQRDHYFFAGGSGITPVMSMIKTLLEQEPLSSCYLLYANRNENSIIFKKTLDDFLLRYEGQFYMKYILSKPLQDKAGGLSGLFGKKAAPSWRGLKGRINIDILDKYMDEHPSKTGKDVYYLCGPTGLMGTVENWLSGKGVENVQIKKEFFTNTVAEDSAVAAAPSAGEACIVEIKLNGETFSATIPAGKTVLDALIDLEKDPPFSCTSGACSTCVAKVTSGSVVMDACFALDDDEVADGYVLTCQARCQTATLSIDFDA